MFGSKDDDCKHVIRFDATNISFSGLEGPDTIKFRLASFQIKRDSLQAAIDIAQVYDLFQYSNCLKAKQFPEGSPEKTMFILESLKSGERLIEFLAIIRVALARPSERIEKALEDWVAYTFSKKIPDEAPIIPQKVRAGGQIREYPPIEEFNQVKRSVTKARMSSQYLAEALEDPHFNINEVYASLL
jgi:hypothetical protein